MAKNFYLRKFSALLPSIDIKEALIALGSDNVFKIPAIPFAFFCYNTENITIPAGTYEAYTITYRRKSTMLLRADSGERHQNNREFRRNHTQHHKHQYGATLNKLQLNPYFIPL